MWWGSSSLAVSRNVSLSLVIERFFTCIPVMPVRTRNAPAEEVRSVRTVEILVPASHAETGGTFTATFPGLPELSMELPPGLREGARVHVQIPVPAVPAVPEVSARFQALMDQQDPEDSVGDCCSCRSRGAGSDGDSWPGLTGEQKFIIAMIILGTAGLLVGSIVLTTTLSLQDYQTVVASAAIAVALVCLQVWLTTCAPDRFAPNVSSKHAPGFQPSHPCQPSSPH